MDEEKSTFEYISRISEINDTSEYMHDKELDSALEFIVKFLVKPDIPISKAAHTLVQLEAITASLNVKKAYYATIDRGKAGSEQANKKNIYYSVIESLNRLCDSIKYLCRQ